jgi:hypothetical protein
MQKTIKKILLPLLLSIVAANTTIATSYTNKSGYLALESNVISFPDSFYKLGTQKLSKISLGKYDL